MNSVYKGGGKGGSLTPPQGNAPTDRASAIKFLNRQSFQMSTGSEDTDDPDDDDLIPLRYLLDPIVIGYLQVADIHDWKHGGPRPNLAFHPSTRYTCAREAPAVTSALAPVPAHAPARAHLHVPNLILPTGAARG